MPLGNFETMPAPYPELFVIPRRRKDFQFFSRSVLSIELLEVDGTHPAFVRVLQITP
jgi:hypothetical protein